MRKFVCLLTFSLVLFLSSFCNASEIQVQVFRSGQMVQAVTLSEGKIRAAAKEFSFDSTTDIWNLSGGCAITVIQDEEHSIRFIGEDANIVAATEDIEWQISSSDPIDIRNIPISELSQLLKSKPQVTRVRIKWFYSMGGYWSENTALYDRGSKTIKQFTHEGDNSTGLGYIYRDLFTGVTDEMIAKAAENDLYSGPFSFNRLKEYGATVEERH